MSIRYAAYGSNLHPVRLRARLPAAELLDEGVKPVEVETLKKGIRTIKRNRGRRSVWKQRFARRNAVARRKRLGTLKLGRRKRK